MSVVKRSPIRTFPNLSRVCKTHLEEKLHEEPIQDRNEEITAIPSALGDQLLVVFGQWLQCRRKQHDDALFKQPPPSENCLKCSLPLPSLDTGSMYKECCGNDICCGCIHAAHMNDPTQSQKCPVCQKPLSTTNIEYKRRMMDLVTVNNAKTIHYLGCDFYHGHHGVSQNQNKALELWHQAGALGYTESYYSIGCAYYHGSARIRKDLVKAKYYWTKAAIAGDAEAMYELGSLEKERETGDPRRALKHFMIAISAGCSYSLNEVRDYYHDGHVTEADYDEARQRREEYLSSIRSEARDLAASYGEENGVDYSYY